MQRQLGTNDTFYALHPDLFLTCCADTPVSTHDVKGAHICSDTNREKSHEGYFKAG